MKRVRVEAVCDGDHEAEVPATVERNLQVDGEESQVDLCPACDEMILGLLVLMERGVRPKRRRPRAKPHLTVVPESTEETCPNCGQSLKNRRSMLMHLRRVHHESIKQYK